MGDREEDVGLGRVLKTRVSLSRQTERAMVMKEAQRIHGEDSSTPYTPQVTESKAWLHTLSDMHRDPFSGGIIETPRRQYSTLSNLHV